MKKLVFAIQVVALIAMLPVYMIAELNHGTVKSQVNHPASATEEKSKPISVHTTWVDATGQSSFLMQK